MSVWWFLSCRSPNPAPQIGIPTEGGRYRVAAERQREDLVLILVDRDNEPVEDAAIYVSLAGVLIDPGECDSEGPARCSHPDGRYVLRRPSGGWLSEMSVSIDADAGGDRGVVRVPDP